MTHTPTDNQLIADFKHHIVEHHGIVKFDNFSMEYLRFRKPGTSCGLIDYKQIHGRLFVSGDYGDAVYNWFNNNSLEWISKCNLGYFHGKCTASEKGSSLFNKEWDSNLVEKAVFEKFAEERDCRGFKKYLDANVPTGDKDELICFCQNIEMDEILNDPDWWEWFIESGETIPVRTRLHLLGLKLGMKQIEDSKAA